MNRFVKQNSVAGETFDFDRVIDRSGTGSEKWGRYAGRDVVPMWVADMDFAAPPAVLEALHQHVEHGVLGYTEPTADLEEEVVAMLRRRYGWDVRPEWILWLPGLVCGLNLCARAFAAAGDAVATFTPIYPPFLSAPLWQDRRRITVPLQNQAGRWVMDAELFERSITPQTRVLLLCHPQNPTGRDFTAEELQAICDVCVKHNIVICSDEVHSDLLLTNREHVPTAALGEEIAARTVTLMAPSKTYNIPGLGCSFAIIPDAKLRQRFKVARRGIVPWVNGLGLTAALAAYRHGEPWRRQLLAYLIENARMVQDFVANNMPGCWMNPVEATYLAWINIEALQLDDAEKFFEQAGVGLMDGRHFDQGGFVRLNFGCPRSVLGNGLGRIKSVVSGR